MKIHFFESTGEAYDACQCAPEIKIGDILFIPSEGVVGIADVWPVAITADHGDLHRAVKGRLRAYLKERGSYKNLWNAILLANTMKYSLHTDLV